MNLRGTGNKLYTSTKRRYFMNSPMNVSYSSIASSHHLYIVMDLQFTITHASFTSSESIYPIDEMQELLWWDVISGNAHEEFKAALLQARETFRTVKFTTSSPLPFYNRVEVGIFPFNEGYSLLIKEKSTKHDQVEMVVSKNLKKLTLLAETANDLITKDEPKDILDTLFNSLSVHLNLDIYFNYLLIEEEQKLKLMNYQGVSADTAEKLKWLEFGQAVCGNVALYQSSMVKEDISNSSEPMVQLIKNLGIKAYACHPLMAYDRLLGTLSFGSKTRDHFSKEELEVIEQVCNQVSITLDRIQLITKLKKTNTELEKANAHLKKTKLEAEKAHNAKADFLAMMSHELRTPLNSILGFSQLLNIDTNEQLTHSQSEKVTKIIKAGKRSIIYK